MSGLAVEHLYRYDGPSALVDRDGGSLLRLATSGGSEEHPRFFAGRLRQPRRTAELLRALLRVVQSRWHIPPAMLARIIAQADPVVTCDDASIRFEGVSGCAGAYARVDLLDGALDGETFSRGTTNVDFGPAMAAALAKVRDRDEVDLAVGADAVELARGGETVVERKVPLPVRWLKSFCEVAAIARRLEPVHDVAGIEARRWIRALPKTPAKRPAWVVAAGRGLRLAHREPRGGGVRVAGLSRLRVLEPIVHHARRVRLYGDPATGACAVVLDLQDARFELVLSPEVWRGLSGEGQALEALARREAIAGLLPKVHAALRWEGMIDPAELGRRAGGVDAGDAGDALAALAARGLVGWDLTGGGWFHRELPFDLSLVEKLQPRLKAARKLVTDGKVTLGESGGAGGDDAPVTATVAGSGVEHRVRLGADGARCTCPWFAKHRGDRGPCKHVLATQLLAGGDGDGEEETGA